jgi:hypothetical protein
MITNGKKKKVLWFRCGDGGGGGAVEGEALHVVFSLQLFCLLKLLFCETLETKYARDDSK